MFVLVLPYVCASEVRNVRFSKNFACFFFLQHPFWDFLICLITDDIHLIVNSFIPRFSSANFFANCLVMPHKFSEWLARVLQFWRLCHFSWQNSDFVFLNVKLCIRVLWRIFRTSLLCNICRVYFMHWHNSRPKYLQISRLKSEY